MLAGQPVVAPSKHRKPSRAQQRLCNMEGCGVRREAWTLRLPASSRRLLYLDYRTLRNHGSQAKLANNCGLRRACALLTRCQQAQEWLAAPARGADHCRDLSKRPINARLDWSIRRSTAFQARLPEMHRGQTGGRCEPENSVFGLDKTAVAGRVMLGDRWRRLDIERLYDEHAQAVFAFLLNFTRHEADTRDLLQEVIRQTGQTA